MKQKLLNSIRLRVCMLVAMMCAAFAGQAWGDETEVYSATFTSVANHSYTQNKTFTLSEQSWTSSVSQVASGIFYLGCNSSNASKGILGKNDTFADEVEALKAADSQYNAPSTMHAYALKFDHAYSSVTKVNFSWSGGNNAFQVYLFGDTGSGYILLSSTNYATSGADKSGSVEWSGSATDFIKFAIVARPGTTTTTATNKTLRAATFTIYESAAPAYTITAQSNNNTYGTVSLDGSVITGSPAVGYRYASPAYTVSPANSATVSQNGNEFSVTPSANTTVTINFEAIPTYTVTLGDNSSTLTETSGGAGVTLPIRSDVSIYSFAGWSATNVSEEKTTAPTIIPAGTYHPTENITLYPVYTKIVGAGSQNESASVTIADYASANSWNSGTAYQPLTMDANISVGGTITGNNFKYYSSDDSWRFYSGGSFTISASNSASLTSVTLTFAEGSLSYSGDAITTNKAFAVTGTSATISASATTKITAISVDYTIINSGTTYYWSNPSAVNVTGVTLDQTSKALNVGDEFDLTATVAPNNATNKEVNWTSSNDALATVVDGHVTALAAGTPTITVTTVDGSFTATCNLTISNVAVTGVTVAPASTSVKIGKTVTLTPTVNPGNATNKNVTWESSNTSIATVDNGVVTGVATGEATITVKSAADPTKSASCTVTVIAAGDGTKANPYDVDEALEIISGYDTGDESATNVYIKGIISTVNSYSSNTITYYISADGTTKNQMQVYKGKGLNNADFSGKENLKEGDVVVVYGKLKDYYSTPEINSGNYIYSLNGVKIPEITFGAPSYEVVYNGSLTITATADCSGAITYTSSDETIAEINATTGVVTPHKSGSVTITANVAASVDNIAGSKGVELTVTDGRASAGIEFADATITKTWGEDFTGQDLTNPNKLAISYSSSAPTVATVNASTGAVEILKAGTTVITATFDGDGDYMAAEESYTLTVNKAAAGLSFSETAFDIDLNDDSFVAPTLNNPNSLTVTYTSSNESIAVVDENTGELLLDTSAEGTATITASFTANDWFNAGSASYSITITDPDRKGTKKNPYTVAEVIAMAPESTSTPASGQSDIYVVGYIVGGFNSKSAFTTTSSEFLESNLAIADDYNETTAANVIPVQLAKDSDPRDNYNVVGHKHFVNVVKVIVKADVLTYFSVPGLKNVDEMNKVAEAVKVTSAGFATWASDSPLDFTDKDIDAYIAITKGDGTGVTFTQINKVPANTGVLLYYEGGKTEEIPVFDGTGAESTAGNKFVKGAGENVATDDGDNYNYILNQPSEKPIGFYRANAQMVAKNRAYISIAKSEMASVKEFLSIDFDIVTGINGITPATSLSKSAQIYNLAGQKMSKLQKGVNIVNGKKVLVK